MSQAIADSLNRRGVASPRGPQWSARHSGKWSVTTVRSILINPAYVGDLVWNRRTDARFHRIADGRAVERPPADARRLERNDETDWIVVRDAHEPIVSRRAWETAKRLREQQETSRLQRGINSRTGKPAAGATGNDQGAAGGWTGPRAKFLLSGLMTCAQCGSRYEGHSQYRKGRDADGRRRQTLGYACGGYIRHGRHVCEIGRIDKDRLEGAVINALVESYQPFTGDDAQRRIAEALQRQLGGELKQLAKTQARIKARLRTIDKKVRNMLDNLTAATRDVIDTRIGELTLERQRLEAKLASLSGLVMDPSEQQQIIAETRRFVGSLAAVLAGGPLDDRQAAVRRCVGGIVVDRDGGTLQVELRCVPTVGGESIAPATRRVAVTLEDGKADG